MAIQTEISIMAYQWNGSEHRWGERVKVNIPIQVSAQPLAGIDGCMKKLSLSGALLKADVDLRLHSLVEVSISLPTPSQHAAVVIAHVSRKFKDDVGVEWCEFAPSVVKDLLRSPTIRLSV
jgi:PilZ domain